jgi:pantetheine-phosphate adenylyltransferase
MKYYAFQRVMEINPAIVVELYRYDEPNRFYHNWEHIETMLNEAQKMNILSDDLFLAIVFHDVIYDPKRNDNEERSAELFHCYIQNDAVKQAILETKTHEPSSKLSTQLCDLDLGILYQGDLDKFIEFENKIFKEYQFVDYKIYKEKRVDILQELGTDPMYWQYVKHRIPNIAVYAGSFNPFHRGHLNILEKAERIFDKVIIARGVNPDKNNEVLPLPESIQYRQIVSYDGLLTDFIKSLDYDVTLIRGLRNSTDLQSELTQYRFLQDFKSDIKVVSIFCDKEYEHISSSAIRQLKKFNKETDYLI